MTNQRDRIMRLPEVLETTGMSRSFIYLQIKDGNFPAQIHLGSRARGWSADAVHEWISSRVQRGTEK